MDLLSVLCPLQVVIQLNSQYPVPNTATLFFHLVSDQLVVITQEKARKVLSTAPSTMGLDPLDYGFHTFRRTDAIYRYIDKASYPTILTTTVSQFLANTT